MDIGNAYLGLYQNLLTIARETYIIYYLYHSCYIEYEMLIIIQEFYLDLNNKKKEKCLRDLHIDDINKFKHIFL